MEQLTIDDVVRSHNEDEEYDTQDGLFRLYDHSRPRGWYDLSEDAGKHLSKFGFDLEAGDGYVANAVAAAAAAAAFHSGIAAVAKVLQVDVELLQELAQDVHNSPEDEAKAICGIDGLRAKLEEVRLEIEDLRRRYPT